MALSDEQKTQAIEILHETFIQVLERFGIKRISYQDVLGVVGNFCFSEIEHCIKLTHKKYPNDREIVTTIIDELEQHTYQWVRDLEKYEE